MNKIHKIVWNQRTGQYQVVSEKTKSHTAKSSSKKGFVLSSIAVALFSMFSQPIMAASIPAGWDNIRTAITSAGDDYVNASTGSNIGIYSTGSLHLTSDASLTFSPAKAMNWGVSGIYSRYGTATQAASFTADGNIAVTYNSNNYDSSGGSRVAIGALWGSTFTFNKNLTVSMENIVAGSGSPEHYGIHAGSGNDQPDARGNSVYSSAIIKGDYTATISTSGAQTIAGMRVIGGDTRNRYGVITSNNSSGLVEVDGKATITMTGGYAQGIYVSGAESIVKLNDADITMNNGLYGSAALKIGKARDVGSENKGRYSYGAGKGQLTATGALNLITTNSDGAAIQIFETNSSLSATGSSKIRSKVAALEVGARDWTTTNNATGITVTANDADWNNTSGSLMLVGKSSTGVSTKAQQATLTFSGSDTNLNPADDGYLLEVVNSEIDSDASYNYAGSNVAYSLSEGLMQGLIYTDTNLGTGTSESATTNVTLTNGATWRLKNNSALSSQETNMTSLSLTDSTLDAAFYGTTASPSSYTAKVYGVNTASTTGEKQNATFTNSVINLAQAKSKIVTNSSYTESQPIQVVGDTLTLDANYVGSNSKIYMDTTWNATGDHNGANSASDKLIITGTASGTTTVIPIGADGQEGYIDGDVKQLTSIINTIPVIEVQGGSDAGTFTGTALAANRAVQVQLTSSSTNPYPAESELDADKSNTQKYYYWTMAAGADQNIVDPRVPGYIQSPRVLQEMGFSTLGTLHERIGENQTIAWDNCGECGKKDDGSQTWGRIYGYRINDNGKVRYDLSSRIYGLQFGHNFSIRYNPDTEGHYFTGIYGAYTQGNSRFYDQYRSENGVVVADEFMGTGNANMFSLGATHTRYSRYGSYLDLVGQVSFVRNKLKGRDYAATKQNGFAVALSAEVGLPYALNKHTPHEAGWFIEPQVQLIYQFTRLGSVNDGVREVGAVNTNGLRGKLGARLAYNRQAGEENYRTNTFYLVGDIWHDFFRNSSVAVGLDKISEQYNRTWWDLGVGGQLPVKKKGYVYADIRYESSFSSPRRSGYNGKLGYKYNW